MHWRTEPTSVEKDRDELCLGVKGQSNSEYPGVLDGRHTANANVRCGEGNNPDLQLRPPIHG
jgi:hypothetical protein